MKYKFPKTIDEAKKVITEMSHELGLVPYFDNKFKNFCQGEFNQAYSGGTKVDFAVFQDWNADVMVLAYLHECGHKYTYNDAVKTTWCMEYAAWDFAFKKQYELFKKKPTLKQCRYAMACLDSYFPHYDNWNATKQGLKEVSYNFV